MEDRGHRGQGRRCRGGWLIILGAIALFLLTAARPGWAVHDAGDECGASPIVGDCTITGVHTPAGNVSVSGDLTIQSGGEIRFDTAAARTLTVGGDLTIDDGGKITANGAANATGGDLTIDVAGNATVNGDIQVNGGAASSGNPGGAGGTLTITVDGNMEVGDTGDITADGRDGSPGGGGGDGGNGGTVSITVGGDLDPMDGNITANAGDGKGSTGKNGGAGGTVTIDVTGNMTIPASSIKANGGKGDTGTGGTSSVAGGTGGAGGPGGTVDITVGGNFDNSGAIEAKGGAGGNGGAGGSVNSGNATAGGMGGAGGNSGNITIGFGTPVDGNATIGGTVTATGGTGGNGGTGGSRTGSGNGNGGDGGDAGTGGLGGTITVECCGDLTVTWTVSAKGGNGGNGGNGGSGKGTGNGGAGGDNASGGNGGTIEMTADGDVTFDGSTVTAVGGTEGSVGTGGTGGSSGSAGGSGTDVGSNGTNGTITINTAQSSVTQTNGPSFDPAISSGTTINVNQAAICAVPDPFPDGAVTFTQGYYGASPAGEALTNDPDLINQATCEKINAILNEFGLVGAGFDDCTSPTERAALALFLSGTVGPGKDNGFLPSGFSPGQNLAAEMITLHLNLRLSTDAGLSAGQVPILASYFINIDPLQDLVGGSPDVTYDPILTTGGVLGACTDISPTDGVCDTGTVVLTTLGSKVKDLDDVSGGTTIQDILDALDPASVNLATLTSVTVNGVTLTRDQVTKILGLINKSFDAGVITGFVAAFDAD